MSSLNIKLTNSLNFLNKLLDEADDICESCYDAIDDLCNVDIDEDKYNPKIRKIANLFEIEVDDTMDDLLAGFELFKRDFDEINSNKNSDEVIYSLRKFSNISDEILLLLKKYSRLILKIDAKRDEYHREKDFVRYIAINKVYMYANRMENLLQLTKKRCDKLANNKDDKE